MSEQKTISIEVKEGSIEHCIAEFRKSGRKCKPKSACDYKEPWHWILDIKTTKTLLDIEFELEPISKPVTAEQVREAIKEAWNKVPFEPDTVFLKVVCKKLGLE